MLETIDRLKRHFNRYEGESPIILRFDTREIHDLNDSIEYCRLNSGATRANSFLGGIAPKRGKDTFLPIDKFPFRVGQVAEVTVPYKCTIPIKFSKSCSPDGPWEEVIIDS
ncbi:hypothetical protein ES705_46406 [subsurface metagenome]